MALYRWQQHINRLGNYVLDFQCPGLHPGQRFRIKISSLDRDVADFLRIPARPLMHPDDPDQRVSHETIYAAIYAHPRGGLKQAMVEALRQEKPARGHRRTTMAGKSFVPEALRIVHRPEQIALRQWPGHWEGDLIKGAFNRSCVGTLVERKTRFVVLCRMDGCTAQDALEGFVRQMKKLPAFLRESLTYDRGTEMTCHVELAKQLNLDIWFADPHAPWQRGSNENTNGLLRQFLPKGIDLSSVSERQPNPAQRHCQIAQRTAASNARLGHARGSNGQRIGKRSISSTLHLTLETAQMKSNRHDTVQ